MLNTIKLALRPNGENIQIALLILMEPIWKAVLKVVIIE